MAETILIWGVGIVLAVSGVLTLARVVTGPTMLDRVVALEVLMGILICSLGVEAAVHRHTTTLPVLVSLSLIGFLGSAVVADPWIWPRARPGCGSHVDGVVGWVSGTLCQGIPGSPLSGGPGAFAAPGFL